MSDRRESNIWNPGDALEQDLRVHPGLESSPVIKNAADISAQFSQLGFLEREAMIVGALDCKCRLIHWRLVAVGASDHLYVRVGEIFHGAIATLASSVILVHNHPSGDLSPSEHDLKLTLQVAEAGLILGYPLVDHVILSRGRALSIINPTVLRSCRDKFAVSFFEPKKAANGADSGGRWRCLRCKKINGNFGPFNGSNRARILGLGRCGNCGVVSWIGQK